MADLIYKLQYNGRTLSYHGWNGYLQYTVHEPILKARYEKVLFSTANGDGTNTGTFSERLDQFDQVGIACSWVDSRSLHGRNWLWFDGKKAFQGDSGSVPIRYIMANGSNYYIFLSTLTYNNSNLTFEVLNNQSTQYWGGYSPINTTATLAATNNGLRHKIVAEIRGVKYQ